MDDHLALLERGHHMGVVAGDGLRAARAAFWLGMNLAIRGEIGPAGGWFGRAQRLVEREDRDCVERGYLLVPVALQHEGMGDYEAAYTAAAAVEVGISRSDALIRANLRTSNVL